jgi:hypothetical protein
MIYLPLLLAAIDTATNNGYTTRSKSRMVPSKMAASATATRTTHISVISLNGSVVGLGGRCAGSVTSRGQWFLRWHRGGRGVVGGNQNLRTMEGERGIEEKGRKPKTLT